MKSIVFTAFANGRSNLSEVRLVLDAVAHRIAHDAWAGRLSEEALERVRAALKSMVRRKVCIVARQLGGFSHKHLEVVWTVGSARILGAQGDWIVGSRSLSALRPGDARQMRLIARIVQQAGCYHDLGKNTIGFQAKLLRAQAVADPLRHELLSLAQLRGRSWDGLLRDWALTAPHVGLEPPAPSPPSQRPLDWVEHLVLTHHRLPGLDGQRLDLRADRHVNADAQLEASTLQSVDPALGAQERADALRNPIPGRLGFALSRLSLMLADHYVSAVKEGAAAARDADRPSALRVQVLKHLQAPSSAKANPDDPRGGGRGQSLAGHLRAVGAMARVIAPRLGNGAWAAGFSALHRGRFASQASNEGRFAWQGKAVQLARGYAQSLPDGIGGLVLVGSSTGSGKTRACLAIADALAAPASEAMGFRVTVALGLRTLTLQTGHEYRSAFELGVDDMSVLIGSRAVLQLDAHAQARARYAQDPLQALGRDEGSDADMEADARDLSLSDEAMAQATQFLPFIEAQSRKVGQRRYLDVPVLVTTLDQVIQAADHRRAGWILPWLRLASSSALILDEVDGYDLSDFPALLRLVEFAAMLGTPVITSSATIYPAFAKALMQAWGDGARERARFLSVDLRSPSCLLVGDETGASRIARLEGLDGELQAYCRVMTQQLAPRRVGMIIGETATTREQVFHAMVVAGLSLHAHNAVLTQQGPRLSVGLVRIAHVRQAVAFAAYLRSVQWSPMAPVVKAVLYHSQNTVLARGLIERRLDAMLYRKKDGISHALSPLQDPQVGELVQQAAAQGRDVCILIIATSVEEVGRDHDFDWAVIEPSSARSIVQACGRVMRHRYELPAAANVAVVARNFREIERIAQGRGMAPCFCQPGFERAGQPFPAHDIGSAVLAQLPASRRNAQGFLIDARMCLDFAPSELGALEDRSIESYLMASFRKEWSESPVASMVRNHYDRHRFRKEEPELCVTLDFEHRQYALELAGAGAIEGLPLRVTRVLGDLALWNLEWDDIVHEFEGLDSQAVEFRQIRLPQFGDTARTRLLVDPLYGSVE